MVGGFRLPVIQDSDFVFGDGKLGDRPLTNGDWTFYLPPDNLQSRDGFEPYDCVTQATLGCVEILLRKEYGDSTTWSRRFLATISGTKPLKGNDPGTVAENLRKHGCCYETDWPFAAPDFDTFYQDPPQRVKEKAAAEFAQYAFGHSWVGTGRPTAQQMMDALTYSPLVGGVYAWTQDPTTGYYIRPPGAVSEHAVVTYGFEKGQYWKIFDSYDQTRKKLAWDFGFDACKRFTLNRQITGTPATNTFWQKFLTYFGL